jgi:hypothetical protein
VFTSYNSLHPAQRQTPTLPPCVLRLVDLQIHTPLRIECSQRQSPPGTHHPVPKLVPKVPARNQPLGLARFRFAQRGPVPALCAIVEREEAGVDWLEDEEGVGEGEEGEG